MFAPPDTIRACDTTHARRSASVERFHFLFRYLTICVAVDRTWELTKLTSVITWGAGRESVGEEFWPGRVPGCGKLSCDFDRRASRGPCAIVAATGGDRRCAEEP